MNRKWIVALVAAAALLCTSCVFFPDEEVLPEAPVLRKTQDVEYRQIAVARGDLIEAVTIECWCQAVTSEKLSFQLSGEPISQVYVSKGDTVTAGTLIAELENTELHAQILEQQEVLDRVNMQVAQMEEKLGLYYERCSALDDAVAANPLYASQSAAAERTCLHIYQDLDYLKKLQAVEQMDMDQLQQKLSMRQIYATIDGTVTFALEIPEGKQKNAYEGTTICTVSDLSESYFSAEMEKGLLKKGDAVIISNTEKAGAEYDANVIDVKPHEKNENLEVAVLQPLINHFDLTQGVVGEITVIIAERRNVLYLPAASVETLESGSVVYCLDENGIKTAKPVEIGAEIDNKVEIISGLAEGELVIK